MFWLFLDFFHSSVGNGETFSPSVGDESTLSAEFKDPQCLQSLSMKMPMQLADRGTSQPSRHTLLSMGDQILKDVGHSGAVVRIGDDILGSLGVHPEIWRPGMLEHMPLLSSLLSPFWPGWCARVGYPPEACCNKDPDQATGSKCFDAIHTWERCCAGSPKPVAQLYQLMHWPQVWVEGPCWPTPPRKIYGSQTTLGRLFICERWQGKFALPPQVRHHIKPERLWSIPRVINYEFCEEAAMINTAMKAVIVAYAKGGLCVFAVVRDAGEELWNPKHWRLIRHAMGAISALCLPMLPYTQDPASNQIMNASKLSGAKQSALADLGGTAHRLLRWMSRNWGQGTATRPEQDALETPQSVHGIAEPVQNSNRPSDSRKTSNCLLTPTHPPHFSNVAVLLEAVRRLCEDPPGKQPLHLIVVDEQRDAQQFYKEWPQFSSRASSQPVVPVEVVTLEDLLSQHSESFHRAEQIQLEHEAAQEPNNFQRYGPCATGWGQVHQGLKKVYGMLYARDTFGCQVTWVLDSDSFPLRPFSFVNVFEAFRASPWVQVQDYGKMPGSFGSPALIFQECVHWIVTHKFRLIPAGAYGYRQSDFWIYNNSHVAEFVQDLRREWGESFLEVWMRAPTHGEGLVVPAWLHLKHAGGKPSSNIFEGAGAGHITKPAEALQVLDVAAVVRARMPQLYQAACQNLTIHPEETMCANDFSIVWHALQALGLPQDSDELNILLDGILPERWRRLSAGSKDLTAKAGADVSTSPSGKRTLTAAVQEFLTLLELLDTLPLFGTQGHGDALRMKALPALLPHWWRATSWCVSNCDWDRHARIILQQLGLMERYWAVHLEVGRSGAKFHDNLETEPAKEVLQAAHVVQDVASEDSPRRQLMRNPLKSGTQEALRCFQWHLSPRANISGGGVENDWQTWDTCLDIVHFEF